MKYRYLLIGLVMVFVLTGGGFWIKKGDTAPAPAQGQETKFKGDPTAPVHIIEYSDFQCPACRMAESVLAAIFREYPGKIYFVFYHFPLPGHQWSDLAHRAAECANAQGKFWPYHDRLYFEQPLWSAGPDPTETFIRYAKDFGLNLDSFAACLSDANIQKAIQKEKSAGEKLQIKSTPTFFINDERIVGHVDLDKLGREAINKALGIPSSPAVPQVPNSPKPADGKT